MGNNKNLLLEQFRACGRLLNEWRDTAFYTAGAALAAATWDGTMASAANNAAEFFLMAGGREVVRSFAWGRAGPHHTALVGGDLGEGNPSPQQCYYSAGIAANSLNLVAGGVFGGLPTVAFIAGFVFVGTTVSGQSPRQAWREIGGWRGFMKTYRYMWDYPRNKGGGGGTTQTQRFVDGLKGLVHGVGEAVTDGLIPSGRRPRPVPIPGNGGGGREIHGKPRCLLLCP